MAEIVLKLEGFTKEMTLYAKGFYPKKDSFEDLKIIVAHIAKLNPEHIAFTDVLYLLIDAFWQFASLGPIERVPNFLKSLCGKFGRISGTHHLPIETWVRTKVTEINGLTLQSLLNELFGFIKLTKFSGRSDGVDIDIGHPDPEITRKLKR